MSDHEAVDRRLLALLVSDRSIGEFGITSEQLARPQAGLPLELVESRLVALAAEGRVWWDSQGWRSRAPRQDVS